MADDYDKLSNKLPAAAAAASSSSSLPVSKDKEEEVSTPLPAMHDVVANAKQNKPLPAAVLVDATTPPAASPVAVLPTDDDHHDEKTPPLTTVGDRVVLTVSLWALVHTFAFIVAIFIANRTPCNKLTWLHLLCVETTDAAAAGVRARLHAELWCIIAAMALAAVPLISFLRAKGSTVLHGRWTADAADAIMAWLALAVTAAIDCMQVASDRIYLAADPGERSFFADVVLVSACLTVDVVLAGLLLGCRRFPCRLVLNGDGEV